MLKTRVLVVLIVIGFGLDIGAQNIGGGGGGSGESTDKFTFLPLPYFNYDRSLEYQFGVLPMAMYPIKKEDTISPATATGLFGMYTTNESWFVMGFHAMFLDEDNWRVILAGGTGNINFQFYSQPINSFLKYNTGVSFFYADVKKLLVGRLYGGLNFVYSDMSTQLPNQPDSTAFPLILRGGGVVFSMDKRDNYYYPKSGHFTNLRFTAFPEAFGNKYGSSSLEWDFNKYVSFREKKDVFASRLKVGVGLGDVKFQQQFIVGFTDIRGYSQGAYRGDQLYALQGEYRWNLAKIFSLVGFAGVATVNGAINEDDNWKLLPGAGGGFRFTVTQKYHMNVGMDAAAGVDDWGIYFRVGEAF